MSNNQKSSKFHARGATGDTFYEKYPKNNFLTDFQKHYIDRFSSTSGITHRNFENFSKFVLGEQTGNFREKSTSLNNFSTVQSIVTK
jgi:hypothetical protein